MTLKKSEEIKKEEKALITFLEKTKNGQYVKIDKNAIAYLRVKEQREPSYNEEGYFYGIR